MEAEARICNKLGLFLQRHIRRNMQRGEFNDIQGRPIRDYSAADKGMCFLRHTFREHLSFMKS